MVLIDCCWKCHFSGECQTTRNVWRKVQRDKAEPEKIWKDLKKEKCSTTNRLVGKSGEWQEVSIHSRTTHRQSPKIEVHTPQGPAQIERLAADVANIGDDDSEVEEPTTGWETSFVQEVACSLESSPACKHSWSTGYIVIIIKVPATCCLY